MAYLLRRSLRRPWPGVQLPQGSPPEKGARCFFVFWFFFENLIKHTYVYSKLWASLYATFASVCTLTNSITITLPVVECYVIEEVAP